MSVRLELVTGAKLSHYLIDLARLRIEVFRAFPYLYDGDLDYERKYLAAFVRSRHAMIVVAADGDTIAGASTCAPLPTQAEEIVEPFAASGIDPERYFYFGESVLLPAYRGQGIGVQFFERRELYARACGASYSVFCAVVRDESHPCRPADYVPLDAFWRKRGYAPMTGMACTLNWKEIDAPCESGKPMQFWAKRL